jgi:two-component system catabolic regulation response regulator CreB
MTASPPRLPILVVEDDATIAGLIGALFTREGFAPTVLRDGRAAIEHVAREAPAAAAVLDVMLPYTDGFSVAEAIRADPRWRAVPVVVLTARAQPADQERARTLEVAEYLVKPFHPQALVVAVRRLLAASAG